jgi:hypothetical protein
MTRMATEQQRPQQRERCVKRYRNRKEYERDTKRMQKVGWREVAPTAQERKPRLLSATVNEIKKAVGHPDASWTLVAAYVRPAGGGPWPPLATVPATDRRPARFPSPTLRFDVLERDGFACWYCGQTARNGVQLEVDHIEPWSKGGLTESDNLRTACRDCNLGKSGRVLKPVKRLLGRFA